MTSPLPEKPSIVIRPVQHRDLGAVERLEAEAWEAGNSSSRSSGFSSTSFSSTSFSSTEQDGQLQLIRQWYGPLKFLSWFPNPCQHAFCVYVAEQENQIRGMIQVSPFNRTRSTWRVERVVIDSKSPTQGNAGAISEVGSMLLRYCFETIWEARTWLLEVNINNKAGLALYRQNGFQPLAQMTYWEIAPLLLEQLRSHEPDLPNLLPVSNVDAQLLYQLDTVSMPPLVRQVYDRYSHDFKTSFLSAFLCGVKHWLQKEESVSGYVFEPQRKAAIGHFQLQICRNDSQPHVAQLTVHPAYTWLYPELMSQMARITQNFPTQSLQLASADYQQEREEYLKQLGAEEISHTLLMSRSVWHKLREAKPISLEGLQLADMLQSLQPARKPVPGRMSWLQLRSLKSQMSSKNLSESGSTPPSVNREKPARGSGEPGQG